MRITLIIATLGSGGSERAMQVLADHWASVGHEVVLVTFSRKDEDFYRLHHSVHRVGLGLMEDSRAVAKKVRNNLRRILTLRREIVATSPDIVVTFGDTTNVKTLVAGLGLKIPIVICEQVDPRQHSIGRMWSGLRQLVYPMASMLVVVSTAMARSWADRVVKEQLIRIIPNPVYSMPNDPTIQKDRGQGLTVAAMGRLVAQKGFDQLLRAFHLCSERHQDWSLEIIGEGSERQTLENLRTELQLTDKVKFLGRVKEPSNILRKADLFVMSSRFEGFPLSLIEAMACGLPVISTDCPTGPSEIIRNGVDGILVKAGDVAELANVMDRLMSDCNERKRLSSRAIEINERFGSQKIAALWDEVLDGLTASSCRKKNVPLPAMSRRSVI